MTRGDTADALAAVARLTEALGIGPVVPVVVSAAEHLIVRLAPLPLIVRVRSSPDPEHARAALSREMAVASYLATYDAPSVQLAGGIDPGPHVFGRHAMTIWALTPHRRAAGEADAWAAALALRALHTAFAAFDGPLPLLTDAIDACGDRIASGDGLAALDRNDRRFLHGVYARQRAALRGFDYRSVPLHGDAHLGNALPTETGIVWTDFEAACRGPIEWDIVALPANCWGAFADYDRDLAHCLADLRSLCVATWCWAAFGRSRANDDAARYHLEVLRKRFGDQ